MLKTRKEILESIHNEMLEKQLRNEIDYASSFSRELVIGNDPLARKDILDNRTRARAAVEAIPRTLSTISDMIKKEEAKVDSSKVELRKDDGVKKPNVDEAPANKKTR